MHHLFYKGVAGPLGLHRGAPPLGAASPGAATPGAASPGRRLPWSRP
jgi:hypothetical protein